jgi:hypothetical protein
MNTPDQDELDVRLARVVYGRVARRWCTPDPECGGWDVRYPGCGMGGDPWRPDLGWDALLWCYVPDPRWPREWAPVPAFGQDGGRMLAALEVYAERTGYVVDIKMGSRAFTGVQVRIWPPREWQRIVEGSTFALAARAAVLAMEDGR